MNVEEAIVAFWETVLWVECDLCGRAFDRPGRGKVMFRLGQSNVCVHCVRSCRDNWGTPAEGYPSRVRIVVTLTCHSSREDGAIQDNGR